MKKTMRNLRLNQHQHLRILVEHLLWMIHHKSFPMHLQYASERLRNDKELVWNAVKENGEAFQFASPKLRSDKTIIATALLKGNTLVTSYVSDAMRNSELQAAVDMIHENRNNNFLCIIAKRQFSLFRSIQTFR